MFNPLQGDLMETIRQLLLCAMTFLSIGVANSNVGDEEDRAMARIHARTMSDELKRAQRGVR